MTTTLPPFLPGEAHTVLAPDHALVWLGGDVDTGLAGDLSRIADQLKLVGLPTVVDLTAVGFADSALMNFLARLARQGQVTLCNPSQGVRNLMTVSGLDSKMFVVEAPDSERPA